MAARHVGGVHAGDPETVDRLLLAGLRLARLAAEEEHLLGLEVRAEARDRAGQAEHVRDAHPVQRAVGHAPRRVEVGVHVEVDESGWLRAGDGADADRAVAAEDDRREPVRHGGSDELGHLAHGLGHACGVHGVPVLAVGLPASERDVAAVVGAEALDEPGLTQRARRLLLPGREGAKARGGADDRQLHNH